MMTDEEHNEILLDVIIAALDGYIKGTSTDKEEPLKNERCYEVKSNFAYILGQSIRQWRIPNENWHTSKAAKKVWDIIVDKNSSDYKEIDKEHVSYKEKLLCNPKSKGIVIPRFKGTTRDFGKICHIQIKGSKANGKKEDIAFNEIFIAEHTTTIADIRMALIECYKKNRFCKILLRHKMMLILNKIHITRMLRIEDRRITDCQNRISNAFLKKKYKSEGIYNYFITKDSKIIYKDIIHEYYENLQRMNTPHTKRYTNTLKLTKRIRGNLPHWARAIDLQKKYNILILQ